jgi:glutathione peroxidase
LNGKQDAPVSWNFQKFMIDSKGDWAGFVEPRTDPFAEDIVKWIEGNE